MICGHYRETWILALRHWNASSERAERIAFEIRPRDELCSAIKDLTDPAKLAAIIAELMRECGLSAASRLDDTYAHRADVQFIPLPNPRCPNANEAIGIYLRANKFDRDLSMPQARKFALALLDAPNVSAQDVERMIGEL